MGTSGFSHENPEYWVFSLVPSLTSFHIHHGMHLWEKKSSVTRVTLTCLGVFIFPMFTDCIDQKTAGFGSVWADSQFTLCRTARVVWGFSLFLKYCGLKFINSQNLKMLKYWLTQLLITGCSYRELEEPPMGFLLQQYCTYYMNKLHCCIMQLLHHQFRE